MRLLYRRSVSCGHRRSSTGFDPMITTSQVAQGLIRQCECDRRPLDTNPAYVCKLAKGINALQIHTVDDCWPVEIVCKFEDFKSDILPVLWHVKKVSKLTGLSEALYGNQILGFLAPNARARPSLSVIDRPEMFRCLAPLCQTWTLATSQLVNYIELEKISYSRICL